MEKLLFLTLTFFYSTLALSVTNYHLTSPDLVQDMMSKVNEPRLLSNMIWYSSFHNRHYQTQVGAEAMTKLGERWASLVKHLNFAKVEYIKHKGFDQRSVILTLKGRTSNTIIVGGHGDSINKDSWDKNAPAPGFDDNASGIGVITEVIQILASYEYQPQNTIKFMAYAAEEVGLLGSMDISARFDEANINVLGVLQFDGTNYHGSKDLAMVLVKDHTNIEQNNFLGSLLDTYLQVPWHYDECGYACSDSYSWDYRGYPASFPAESRIKEENPFIHTANDTKENSGDSAEHSVNFAKLGLAYVIELDKANE